MHYSNGRLARNGDIVIGESYNNKKLDRVGIICNINPGTSTCNCIFVGKLDTLRVGHSDVLSAPHHNGSKQYTDYSDCSKFLHIEDYLNGLKENIPAEA